MEGYTGLNRLHVSLCAKNGSPPRFAPPGQNKTAGAPDEPHHYAVQRLSRRKPRPPPNLCPPKIVHGAVDSRPDQKKGDAAKSPI